jgi:hypothetical protein
VDHVVEAQLEQRQEPLTRAFLARAGGATEDAPELALPDAVQRLGLLLLPQPHGEGRLARATRPVLAGRGGAAALERGLARERTGTLQPQVHARAALQLLLGARLPSHEAC